MEAWFYELGDQPPQAVLPALLEACLARQWRAVVQTDNLEQAQSLDIALWSYAKDSFLPHGVIGDDHMEHQPIWITHQDDTPNGAHIEFLLHATTRPPSQNIIRQVYLLSGSQSDALGFAKPLWQSYESQKHSLRWIRRVEGKWQTQTTMPPLAA